MTERKGRDTREFKQLWAKLDAKQKVLVQDVLKALTDGADPDPIIMRARWLPKVERVSLVEEMTHILERAA